MHTKTNSNLAQFSSNHKQLDFTIPISNTARVSPSHQGQIKRLIQQSYYIALVIKKDDKMLALVELRHMTQVSRAGLEVCVMDNTRESTTDIRAELHPMRELKRLDN
jgi:hypothetical protein